MAFRTGYAKVEKQIADILREILFFPVMRVIRSSAPGQYAALNRTDDVLRGAIRSGQVQYADGVFSGRFSASIGIALRSLGATFDKRSGVYRLAPALVPAWIHAESGAYQENVKEAHRTIVGTLRDTQADLDRLVQARPVDVGDSIDWMESGVHEVAQRLRIKMEITPEMRKRISEGYTHSLIKDIGNFTRKEIVSLRERVEENALAGYRVDRLIDVIKHRHAMTENKARAIARDETFLFMSKFREERFKEAGMRRYTWSSSEDERVRPLHQKLNGRVFSYDDPPIADDATNTKANPGAVWGCRCIDIPIFERMQKAA